jgi:hypothetical protein
LTGAERNGSPFTCWHVDYPVLGGETHARGLMWNWRASGGGHAPRSRASSVGGNAGTEALVPTEEALIRRVQAPIQECVNFTSSLY